MNKYIYLYITECFWNVSSHTILWWELNLCSHIFFSQKMILFSFALFKLKNDNSLEKCWKTTIFQKRHFSPHQDHSLTDQVLKPSVLFIIKINKFNIYMLFLLCCCYFHLSWKNEGKKSQELQMTVKCAGEGEWGSLNEASQMICISNLFRIDFHFKTFIKYTTSYLCKWIKKEEQLRIAHVTNYNN